jgi:hypothetical protein
MKTNNKLLAEFLGWTLDNEDLNSYRNFNGSKFKHLLLSSFKFDTDWNWLMEVVEKIENYNDSATLFIIEDERCHVNTQNGFEIDSVGHTKIEATYNACVEFVKWYNEQK